MKLVNTLKQHLGQPEVTPSSYVRWRHIELASSITGRYKIYLDTRYWIMFRDVVIGRRTDENLVALLDRIRNAVESDRAICPVSQDSFAEIFMQSDPDTLSATIRLVDQLSGAVCLRDIFTRMDAELWHFLTRHKSGNDAALDRNQLIWTKCGYVLGYVAPQYKYFTREQSDAIEKAFFDQMWNASFADILQYLGCRPEWKPIPDSADKYNQGKFANANAFSSFKQLFMIELAGILDFLKDSLSEIMFQIYLSEAGAGADPNAKPDPAIGEAAANLIYNIYNLDKMEEQLPTLSTYVTLHAAFRWQKNRRYKANDFADLRHAVMALPCCDMFLTEKPLCHLIHERHHGLAERFVCKTYAEPDLAIASLIEANV